MTTPTPPDPVEPPIDIAILTAIEVERKAACVAFGLGDEARVKMGGRWYWRGRLALREGDAYEILVAQPIDMGPVEAALLVSDVIHHWKPKAALLVGIAASADPNSVKLGDIVVGTRAYYYEHGKLTPAGTKRQPEIIPADAELLHHVVGLAEWDGVVTVRRPDGTSDKPKVHRGVIASGEKVIADAAVRDEIAFGHRKILAIEMEGYGFSRAVWQRVPHLSFRGICDYGSSGKSDDWREYAAASVAAYVKHFILDRPVSAATPRTISPSTRPYPTVRNKHPRTIAWSNVHSQAITWSIELDTELEDVSRQKIDAVLEQLRRLTGDASIRLREIRRGSIVLILDGSREGYGIAKALHRSGQLKEVLSLPVLQVEWQDDAGNHTTLRQRTSTIESDDDDPNFAWTQSTEESTDTETSIVDPMSDWSAKVSARPTAS